MNKVALGDWIFDPATHQLIPLPGGAPLMLENRQAQLLTYFCQNPGRDLSKDELLRLWSPRVVHEDALYVAIAGLRKALGDDSRSPTYLKTLPGIGYRMIALVREPVPAPQARRGWRRATLAISLVTVLAGVAIGGYVWRSPAAVEVPAAVAEDFRRAKFLLGKGPEHHAVGMDALRQIMVAVPEFADAYAEAAAHQLQRRAELTAVERAEVEAWLDRALTLAPDHALAHLAEANFLFLVQWRLAEAKPHFEAGLASAESHLYYAQYQLALGELDQALAQVQRYTDLEPQGYGLTAVAWIHAMAGRHDAALAAIDQLHSIDPQNVYYHVSRQGIFEVRGEMAAAFAELYWLMDNAGYEAHELALIQQRFGDGGLPNAYRWLLEEDKKQLELGQYRPPLSLARYALSAGDHQAALHLLEQAVAARQTEVLWLRADPKYRPLWGEPGFAALLVRIGLPPL